MIERQKHDQAGAGAGDESEGLVPTLNNSDASYVPKERVINDIRRNVPDISQSDADNIKDRVNNGVPTEEIVEDYKKSNRKPRPTQDHGDDGLQP